MDQSSLDEILKTKLTSYELVTESNNEFSSMYDMWETMEENEGDGADKTNPMGYNWKPMVEQTVFEGNFKGKGRFVPISIKDQYGSKQLYVILVSYNKWFYIEDCTSLRDNLERDYDLELLESHELNYETGQVTESKPEQIEHE